MDGKLTYWGATLFSAAALVLVIVNISLATSNRALQTEVATRQSALNAGQGYSQLNQGLVQALAESSLKNNDTLIRDLLSSQGITIKTSPADKPK